MNIKHFLKKFLKKMNENKTYYIIVFILILKKFIYLIPSPTIRKILSNDLIRFTLIGILLYLKIKSFKKTILIVLILFLLNKYLLQNKKQIKNEIEKKK